MDSDATAAATASEDIELDDLFASDLEPERITFRVKGAPDTAWVDLLPMDSSQMERFMSMATRYGKTGDQIVATDQVDLQKMHVHLVGNTLTDFRLWKREVVRNPQPGDPPKVWVEVGPPRESSGAVNRAAIPRWVEANLKLTPGAWAFLVGECYRVNKMGAEQQGN